jgi:glutathione S-transferase
MKLHYCETPNPRKACAVARYLNSPVEFIHVDLVEGENRTPKFLALNPNGRVPVLETGATMLWEANAIMCYLAKQADSDIWPDDARQIEIIRWFSWDQAHFSRHAGTLFFEHVIKPRLGIGTPDQAAIAQATGAFVRSAAILEAHLCDREFLVGGSLTLADFAVAMLLPDAAECRLPLNGHPEIQRWHARLNEFDAWRRPFPERAAKAA